MTIKNNIVFAALVLLWKLYDVSALTVCTKDETTGEKNGLTNKIDVNAETGVLVVLTQTSEFGYDCCGFVYEWKFHTAATGSFDAQVWRPQATELYLLIGSNSLTSTNPGTEEIRTIANGQRIRANKNDYPGMHSTGGFIVTYFNEGPENIRRLTGITTAIGVSTTLDTSGATVINSDYAIRSTYTPSEAPQLTSLGTVTVYNDDVAIGKVLTTITYTDNDQEDIGNLTLTLESATNSGTSYFELVADEIRIKATPPLNTYNLQMKVEDLCTVSSTGTETIEIINRLPVINNLPDAVSISEDTADNTLIFTFNATDTVTDPVTCAKKGGGTVPFYVAQISGSTDYGVYKNAGVFLNSVVTASYTLTVECDDGDDKVDAVLTIKLIINQPPTIANLPMSSEIPESWTAESLLYTISVTDPTNDTVTCALTIPSTIYYLQPGSVLFETEIWVLGNQGFVYDTQRQYTLNIECSDQRRSDSGEFYVYILRNMPPYFSNLQDKTSVSSETSAAGQIIYTVDSVDPENDNVQYSLSSNTTNVPFAIDQNTGEISFTRSINAELVAGYDLYISLSDGRNVVAARSLTVLITDINFPPSFQLPSQIITVFEGTHSGSSIFQPTITDEDLLDSHTFSVIYNPPEGAVYFNVNQSTGLITSLYDIDYETIPFKSFLLIISASDSLSEDTTNITLNIQDINEPPVFTKTNYSLTPSESTGGTALYGPFYQYTDEDGGAVKFSLDCGADTGRLDIDSSSGLLSFSADYDLDMVGTASQINCNVTISDNEYTDMAYINITISNDNDNAPVFTYSIYTFYIPVTSNVGSIVGQVQAIDNDIGSYGNIFYHIALTDFNYGLFHVNENGSIFVSQSLTQYSEGSILNLTIYAVDIGNRQASTLVYIVFLTSYAAPLTQGNGIQFFTFFRYSPNMAWFVPLMCVLFVTVCVVTHTIYTTNCTCLKSISKTKQKRLIRSL
ncbi:cadherin EGF LAG seven-pass G-type receptor 2-like [Mytilus edulis]|uniref:cadherin EGF LAG seven-pass G-type receptor 2-like n=1 Tax=Mytilus edulis TaxID=6550 RepID=UPI0039EFE25E